MNDNRSPCTCPKCSEVAAKYGYSAQLIEFLNELSKLVAPKYPDIYICALAYHYSDAPPKNDIKTEKNVVIRLCDTTTNQALSILHPENAKFKSYVEEWKKHTDNLSIWDYAVAYKEESSAYPFASEFYYGDLYKFYRDNNVTGIFWEHEYEFITDMYEYKFFLECKLMEDPDADLEKLQNIFMTRYYGAAAPFVMEYRRIIDKACRDNKGSVPFSCPLKYTAFDFLTASVIRELDAVMDRAEAAVNGDALLISRIRRARLGIDLLTLKRSIRLNSHGIETKGDPFIIDKTKLLKRLTVDWRKWAEQFHDGKYCLGRIDAILNAAEGQSGLKPFMAPKEFKDKQFFYFRPEAFVLFGGTIKLVDDADSITGKTAKINGKDSHYYKLPFEMGCYDNDTKRTAPIVKIDAIGKTGYNWYKLGSVNVKKRSDLYFNRAWTIQIPISCEETVGNTFDVWASLKFTGPMYHPDEKAGDSFMYLDLVILEETKD